MVNIYGTNLNKGNSNIYILNNYVGKYIINSTYIMDINNILFVLCVHLKNNNIYTIKEHCLRLFISIDQSLKNIFFYKSNH